MFALIEINHTYEEITIDIKVRILKQYVVTGQPHCC